MFSFMPRESGFFDLFEQASQSVVEAGQCWKTLMKSFDEPHTQIQHSNDLEHKGDDFTRDIVYKLNKTFITPLDRDDIHALASALDNILDEIDAVAELFMALSHGANDAQKAMGIITLALLSAGHIPSAEVPKWVIISCALSMGLGRPWEDGRSFELWGCESPSWILSMGSPPKPGPARC